MAAAFVLKCRQRRLYLVHRGHHGAAVGCGRLLEARLGERDVVSEAAALEDRRREVAEQIAKPLIDVEETVGLGGLDTERPGERQRREQFGATRPDRVARGFEAQRRRPHVRSLQKQVRRNACGDRIGGRHGSQRLRQHPVQLVPESAHQHRQPPLRVHELTLHLWQHRLRVEQLLPDQIEFGRRDQSALVAGVRKLLAFEQDILGLAGERDAAAQIRDLEIGRDRLGQHADARRIVVRLGCEVVQPGRFRVVAGPAPEVELVREFGAE